MQNTCYYHLHGTLASSEQLHGLARQLDESGKDYLLLQLQEGEYEITETELKRLQNVLADTQSAMVYSDYRQDGTEMECIDYQMGSLRDDFDFGPLVLVSSKAFLEADGFVNGEWADEEDSLSYEAHLRYAALYQYRLIMSLRALPFHLNETGYTFVPRKAEAASQFDYVNPRNREVQVEYEKVVTQHLRDLDALVDARMLLSADGEQT
ncbi:MAG: hypothetical protein J6W47_08260, partial [Bacteroidales bacterium]|nr:hypothetical protein [Bacteroidales bacterium]